MEETSRDRARLEILGYIQAMLIELCSMARHERFDMLVYLIEMACTEASETLSGRAPPEPRARSVNGHDEGGGGA